MTAANPQILINAANEGIPVAAIARVVQKPLDEVYDDLYDAQARGAIIEIPRADWPPGVRIRERVPAVALPSDDDLRFLAGKAYKLTQLEAGFLVSLLRHRQVEKSRLHGIVEHQRQTRSPNDHDPTDPKMVDVMICKLRKKLKIVDASLKIETVWGSGYYIETDMKAKIIAHLDGGMHAAEEKPATQGRATEDGGHGGHGGNGAGADGSGNRAVPEHSRAGAST